ncbi:MAG: DNA (cytosine-5-)-methyltransferase [Arenicellales bacterium IbO2]|nr:DNA cytosine methyltransferase [Gammaproteobacteria bacterium]MDA8030174.1 DNA cytosine methyltransferase [Alphaproteobacteria bacterium]CAJ2377685.1 MAG: DNA (cytosine-5-)-methyltransferase [Arenicellales bacterium IbO2]
MTSKILKVVDFFCGAGGMTQGMKMAGLRVLAGIDIDPECEGTYRTNHPNSEFLLKDIKKLPSNFLKKKCGVEPDDDHLVFTGCSPCQYWTFLNTDKRSSAKTKGLLGEFWRFVRYYNPGYVVVENVPGIKTWSDKSGLDKFHARLEKKGYSVKMEVINAAYYGVPQSRKRFVLIASRVGKSIGIPRRTEKPALLKDFIGEHNGFPELKAGHRDSCNFMHTVSALSEKNLARLKSTTPDGGTRMAWKDNHELQLKTYRGRDNSFRDVYGRLRWNMPASTITTRFNGISNGRFAHPEEHRGLSLREGAALQTFANNYVFKSASIKAVARLIGNAVPPELARRIGMALSAG